MAINLILMSREQRLHMEVVNALWTRYGQLLRQRDQIVGGMQWKPAAGYEYLTRYRPDPETGKKTARSLGRRSAETEQMYADFMRLRSEVQAGLAALAPEVEDAGRVAKALRLGRIPARQVEGLRNLWARGLLCRDGPLSLLGANALIAYEAKSRIMVPPRVLRDDMGPVLYVRDGVHIDIGFALSVGSLFMPKHADVGLDELGPGHFRLQCEDGSTLDLINRTAVEARLEAQDLPRGVRRAFEEALELQPVEAVAIGRDGSLVALQAVDPRTFSLLTPVLSDDREDAHAAAWDRAEATSEIIHEHWEDGFTHSMKLAMEHLRELAAPDGGGSGRLRY
ncbi:hypothetical protein ILT44_07020 [Microvirga sp. BT689]|uniref:hypothetical protein n=1 Tax=Microvirga arvi TaxID=2778731 RepID=UPI0019507DCB|nr:hypothetical protein [Microvirga arvi]MBM6579927.1 hypothetical protein [Microvirga arvi]